MQDTADIEIDVCDLISEIDRFSIDRNSIPQNQLDLVNRSRKSLFSWRGQFSPELIELLLTHYANCETVVLDPFVGSGTTLFEAARKSLTCFGTEINPAAVEMARTVHFVNVDFSERMKYIEKAGTIIKKYISLCFGQGLFPFEKSTHNLNVRSLEETFPYMLDETSDEPLVYNIIINTLLRYVTLHDKGPTALLNAFGEHKDIIQKLPFSKNPCKVFYSDARNLPIEDESVDLVITSPPYINVFNYHQNYRKIMELAGWNLLHIAKSEIGSNRKNRGNRFLTVIQYAVDMLQALHEMRRVIRPTGRIIIIIGRKSNVRGVSFENYRILSALAVGGAGLELICRQERKFVTRYGERIYEDLLHFKPAKQKLLASDDFARKLGIFFLEEALREKTVSGVHKDIVSAIANAPMVQASPLFTPEKSSVGAQG